MSSDFFARVQGLHSKLADAIGNPDRVWCRQCGRSVKVNAAVCLKSGWPKCHEQTMTIDHPSEWGEDTPAKRRALEADAERKRQAEEAQ